MVKDRIPGYEHVAAGEDPAPAIVMNAIAATQCQIRIADDGRRAGAGVGEVDPVAGVAVNRIGFYPGQAGIDDFQAITLVAVGRVVVDVDVPGIGEEDSRGAVACYNTIAEHADSAVYEG